MSVFAKFDEIPSLILQDIKETRFDVYETLCPQQMLVYKGGQIKNWRGECRDKIAVSKYSKSTSKSKSAKGDYSKKNKRFLDFHQLIYSSSSIS